MNNFWITEDELKLKKRANKSLRMTDGELLRDAKIVFSKRKYVSTSALQIALQIPFSRSSKILEQLIADKFAFPSNDSTPRLSAWVIGKRIKN